MDEIFARVLRVYASQWRSFLALSGLVVFPLMAPMVVFQASLEGAASDPIYLFRISIDSPLERIGDLLFLFYYRIRDYLNLPLGVVFLITSPILFCLASSAMTQLALDESRRKKTQKPEESSSTMINKKKWWPHDAPLASLAGPSVLGLTATLAAATILPLLVGPVPLEVAAFVGMRPAWIAALLALGILAVPGLAMPLLLVYPIALAEPGCRQAIGRSRKLSKAIRFELWFGHAMLLFLQVSLGQLLRCLAAGCGFGIWGQFVLQNLSCWVFLPAFFVLPTDLYTQCRIRLRAARQAKLPLLMQQMNQIETKGMWAGTDESSSSSSSQTDDERLLKLV